MIRPVLTELALFLAPFVALRALSVGRPRPAVFERASWPPKTLAWLAIVALILMIGSFIYLAHFSGAPPGVDLCPGAYGKDGNFVPGQFK